MDVLAYFIIFGAALSMSAAWWNSRRASPVLAIFNRWLRWVFFSLAAAYLMHAFGWSDRPYWVLAATVFMVWFLLETLYNWLAISTLSKSDIPLFPRFSANDSGQEWPMQQRLTLVRDWLAENGYKKVQAVQADLGMGLKIRSCVYEDTERRIRLQVVFIPNRTGSVSACYSLASQTEGGTRLVTDNLFLPFGGFYPENWRVERRPWTRSLVRLIRKHRHRLETCRENVVPFASDPVDELNHQQSVLEKVNTELGFLIPHHLRDEQGKITREGRYRVWKEVWMLSYLGATNRY
jgi:hypothetical protein